MTSSAVPSNEAAVATEADTAKTLRVVRVGDPNAKPGFELTDGLTWRPLRDAELRLLPGQISDHQAGDNTAPLSGPRQSRDVSRRRCCASLVGGEHGLIFVRYFVDTSRWHEMC